MSDKAGDASVDVDRRYLALVRKIITSERFCTNDGLAYTLGVASALEGAGSTTVAVNIGITLAGLKNGPVLIVDGNDSSPALARIFQSQSATGWQNALAGAVSPSDCVVPSHIDDVSLALNGFLSPGEIALYSASSVDEIIDEWRCQFPWIVFDLGSVQRNKECGLVAGRLDGVLLVIEADRTSRDAVKRASADLRRAGVALFGAVYNKGAGLSKEYH